MQSDKSVTPVFIVIAAIFYGDVGLGITLPLATILSPLLLLSITWKAELPPTGFWLICGLSGVVAIQALAGTPPTGRSDLITYLPLTYAAWALLLFSRIPVSATTIVKASVVGAAITGSLMLATMHVGDRDLFWVKSQHIPSAAEIVAAPFSNGEALIADLEGGGGRATRIKTRPTAALSEEDFAPAMDAATFEFYEDKVLARNALGFSNYIAAFLVAAAAVVLFATGRWKWFAFFGLVGFIYMTYSRFGAIFLVVTIAIWLLSSWVRINLMAAGLIVGVLVSCVLLLWFDDLVEQYQQLASVTARIRYWQSGLALVGAEGLLGTPRSYLQARLGASVYWNPHNGLLWIWSLFGLAGVTLYCSYVYLAMRSVYRAACKDPVWNGVFLAMAVLVAWSMVEPIVVSPAFEIFVAAMYGASWAWLRRHSCHPSTENGSRKCNPRASIKLGAIQL